MDTCPVVWPVETSQAARLASVLDRAPEHRCMLPAGHVSIADPRQHACHCGSWAPVRDVEPVQA